MPVVHFGYWNETLTSGPPKATSRRSRPVWADGNPTDAAIGAKLGFDQLDTCCTRRACARRLSASSSRRCPMARAACSTRKGRSSCGATAWVHPQGDRAPAQGPQILGDTLPPKLQYEVERVPKPTS